MTCCADESECPMHRGDSLLHSASHLTQSEADSCCAAAEGNASNPPAPSFATAITAAVLGVGIMLPATAPDLDLSDAWRASAPIPIGPVSRHVLLSVFLV